jgi:hypothetical protein
MPNIFGTDFDDLLNGTGDDDRIYAFGGKDKLYGGAGNDKLYGGAGNDQLFGGAGNDTLRGDLGADFMSGGAGNDTYYIDDPGDVISEETVAGVDDGGTDRVYTSISYTLGNFIERATVTGSAAANLTGNAVANTLVGNSAANILNGGEGNDWLTGGGGIDTFAFGPADASSIDKVTDFSAGEFIGITANDYALFSGMGLVLDGSGNFVLDPTYFALISGSSVQGTVSGHGQFLYNSTSRTLMWDADGSGSAFSGVGLATFNTGTVLSDASFRILGPVLPPAVGNISIGDVTITEGDAGTKLAVFTVSRTGLAAFSVDYATQDGTATAGDDYVFTNGTLNFSLGEATKTLSVVINGDVTLELNEFFSVNLSNATNFGVIIDPQGIGTIADDDKPPVVGDISISDVTIAEGNSGTRIATFTVSRTGTAEFSVDYATANGSATAGIDYVAINPTALYFAAGQATQTISVTINSDTAIELNETYFVNLSNASNGGVIVDPQGIGTISNDDSTVRSVVHVFQTSAFGSPDPAGLAYVAGLGLFVADSEVDEAPFSRSDNLFRVQLDGSNPVAYSLSTAGPGFITKEPTGLAYDVMNNRLYISDDDLRKVFWVDPNNPTIKLGEFTAPAAADDVEDIAVNPNTGNLYIVNGLSHTIVETTTAGVQVGPTITLPSIISDPEALVYDAQSDSFYVGGGFSDNIWRVDRSGNILETIDLLDDSVYRNPLGLTTRAHVKDLELAPTSDPNDDPSHLSLYVADYGNTHLSAINSDDGRIFEIDLGMSMLV